MGRGEVNCRVRVWRGYKVERVCVQGVGSGNVV